MAPGGDTGVRAQPGIGSRGREFALTPEEAGVRRLTSPAAGAARCAQPGRRVDTPAPGAHAVCTRPTNSRTSSMPFRPMNSRRPAITCSAVCGS